MLPTAHQDFVHRATAVAAATPGLVGLAVGGSWLEGAVDEFSDLDLVLVVDPALARAVTAQRRTLAAALGPLLECFTGEHVGEPRLLICLYAATPLLHVDLKFVELPDLAQRIETPHVLWQRGTQVTDALAATAPQPMASDEQWLEDRFWIWVHYAATKLGRGELLETISFLGFLRMTVLGPLLAARHGQPIRGVRKLEQFLPSVDLAALHATVAAPDTASCVAAVRAAIELYRRLRRELKAAHFVEKGAVEEKAVAYFEEVAARVTG